MMKRFFAALMLVFLAVAPAAMAEGPVLMMATTTSTDNTGLLDYLSPEFKNDTGVELRWTATGTGKALKMGENCDVDLLMVHAPAAEKAFTEAGFGMDRKEIMFNDFVIIGPEADPAGIKGKSVAESLKTVMEKKAVFVSRGDNSGTHKKELSLWKAAEIAVPEKEEWYVQDRAGNAGQHQHCRRERRLYHDRPGNLYQIRSQCRRKSCVENPGGRG